MSSGQFKAASLRELLGVAESAVVEASRLIRERGRGGLAVERKAGGESLASQVVTALDREVEDRLLAALTESRERWDIGLLSEERGDSGSRFATERFWCVDPLDGTLPFLEGRSGYAVSVALVRRDGFPLLGVVADAESGTVYRAGAGLGAWRAGEPWALRETGLSGRPLTWVMDRSLRQWGRFDELAAEMERLATGLGFDGIDRVDWGGAAMNAMWTLERAPACYFKFPKKRSGGGCLWDFAAAACVASELGAFVSDMSGRPLPLNQAQSVYLNEVGTLFASEERIATAARALWEQRFS